MRRYKVEYCLDGHVDLNFYFVTTADIEAEKDLFISNSFRRGEFIRRIKAVLLIDRDLKPGRFQCRLF